MSDTKNKRKQQMISAETIENIRETFKTAKIERTYTISEALTTLKNDIVKMRKEGMSLSQVADILAQHNVHASKTLISRIAPAPQQNKTTSATDKTKTATQKTNTKLSAKTAAQQQNKHAQQQNKSATPKNTKDGFEIDPYAADNI